MSRWLRPCAGAPDYKLRMTLTQEAGATPGKATSCWVTIPSGCSCSVTSGMVDAAVQPSANIERLLLQRNALLSAAHALERPANIVQ